MTKEEIGRWLLEHGLIEHRMEKFSKQEQIKATSFGIEVFVVLDQLIERLKK
jgi:hypothetical protein